MFYKNLFTNTKAICLIAFIFVGGCHFNEGHDHFQLSHTNPKPDPDPDNNVETENKKQLLLDDWDVNDLTVLYPIRTMAQLFRAKGDLPRQLTYLDAKNKSTGKPLLSNHQFESILDVLHHSFGLNFRSSDPKEGGGYLSGYMNQRSKWAIVGWRLHECSRDKASDPCKRRLALVAHPMDAKESITYDYSLHLFYDTGKSTLELAQQMARLRHQYAPNNLKSATKGEPLGIHPVLLKAGMDSEFAKRLQDEFTLKHLDSTRLTKIAVSFTEPNRLQPWVMFELDPKSDMKQPEKNSIFIFDAQNGANDCDIKGKNKLVCRMSFKDDFSRGSIEDTLELQNKSDKAGFSEDGSRFLDSFITQVQEHFAGKDVASPFNTHWAEVFDLIENPDLTLNGETNCVSCHRVQTETTRLRSHFDRRTEAFTTDYRFARQAITGCTQGSSIDHYDRPMKTFSVRMFGYLHKDPIIGGRVVNETIKLCESLRSL